MKRQTRKVEKRTYTLQNAIPRFISLVGRGANFAPLAELRYSENEKFSEVEIHQIVFSKEKYDREGVEQYLAENDYIDCEITEDDATYIVPGVAADEFSDIQAIEYTDGVKFFVGTVTENKEIQSNRDIVDSEVHDFSEESTEVATEEVVAEQDTTEEVVESQENELEEIKAEGTEVTGEESTDEFQAASEEIEQTQEEVTQEQQPQVEDANVFNDKLYFDKVNAALAVFSEALEIAKTESFSAPAENNIELFTEEQVQERINAAVEDALAKYAEENKETIENTVDEKDILVQNTQVVITEDISTDSIDEGTSKFSQRKSNDLFGLRR